MKLFMTSESILASERSTTFFAHERLGSGMATFMPPQMLGLGEGLMTDSTH
jgi:hypothetical protein